MLGKLLKYEFRATSRIMLVFYAALIIMSVVTKVGSLIMPDNMWNNAAVFIPAFVIMLVYAFLLIAAFIVTWLLIIQRFYKNLIQNEGYLMHTLPVKTWQLITSKLTAATVWAIASTIIGLISIQILAGFQFNIAEFFSLTIKSLPGHTSLLISSGYALLMLLIVIAWFASGVLILYASMAVGQTVNKHKVLASFAAYIVFRSALQFAALLLVTIFARIAEIASYDLVVVVSRLLSDNATASVFTLLILILAGMLLICAVFFGITEYFMRKKLNLE